MSLTQILHLVEKPSLRGVRTESRDCELRVYSKYIIRTGNLHDGPLAATPLPLFVKQQGPLD
jgi:hypothetical protein